MERSDLSIDQHSFFGSWIDLCRCRQWRCCGVQAKPCANCFATRGPTDLTAFQDRFEITPEMMGNNLDQGSGIRGRDHDVLFKAARAQNGRIDFVWPVSRADNNHAFGFRGTIEEFEHPIDEA
jgi:hypothetical protein